jgi:hypothetical protein
VINEFGSLKDAAKYVLANLASSNKKLSGIIHGIERHCKGEIKKRYYYGFEWKFRVNV